MVDPLAVLSAVVQARLPLATLNVAVHLLLLAHPDNGYARLVPETFHAHLGLTDPVTIRRHLARLQKIGVLDYTSRRHAGSSCIHVAFGGWADGSGGIADAPDRAHGCAGSHDHPAEAAEQPDGPDPASASCARDGHAGTPDRAQGCAGSHDHPAGAAEQPDGPGPASASCARDGHAGAPDRAHGRADPSPIPPRVGELDDPAVSEEPTHSPPGSAQERDAGYALLVDADVGVMARQARTLAANHGFRHLRNHTLAWLQDRKRDPHLGAGALVYRIRHGPAPEPSPAARASDFFHRHRSAEERQEAEDAAAELAAVVGFHARRGPLPAPDPAAALWAQVVAELALILPADTATGLRFTSATATPDGLRVCCPDAQLQLWLIHRLQDKVERLAGQLAGRPVAIEFVVAEER